MISNVLKSHNSCLAFTCCTRTPTICPRLAKMATGRRVTKLVCLWVWAFSKSSEQLFEFETFWSSKLQRLTECSVVRNDLSSCPASRFWKTKVQHERFSVRLIGIFQASHSFELSKLSLPKNIDRVLSYPSTQICFEICRCIIRSFDSLIPQCKYVF